MRSASFKCWRQYAEIRPPRIVDHGTNRHSAAGLEQSDPNRHRSRCLRLARVATLSSLRAVEGALDVID